MILESSSRDFSANKFGFEFLSSRNFDKTNWSFYILNLLEELDLINRFQQSGLYIHISSQIPVGSGLSSSHALILASFKALVELFDLKKYQEILASRDSSNIDKAGLFEIIKLCQRVENAKGFNSGLGDQSAQLLGKKGQFVFIKILPNIEFSYHYIPDDLAIISVPSFIKAEKSLPEFKAANENIALYKTINEQVKSHGANYLADLIYSHSEIEIFKFLESIKDLKVRGLALYGLAEAKRISLFKQSLDSQALGKHLNLSHQAELNFHYNYKTKSLTEFTNEEKLSYEFNQSIGLAEHSGLYRASTKANDELYYLAKAMPEVYGSSISGAGLGGNNTVLCRRDAVDLVRNRLNSDFYEPKGFTSLRGA